MYYLRIASPRDERSEEPLPSGYDHDHDHATGNTDTTTTTTTHGYIHEHITRPQHRMNT